MLFAILTLFAGFAAFLIGLLPAGPDFPPAAANLLREGVAFIKALDVLIDVQVEFYALSAVFGWEMSKMAWSAAVWVYKRIRGG